MPARPEYARCMPVFLRKSVRTTKNLLSARRLRDFHTFGGRDLPIFYDFRSKDARFLRRLRVIAGAKLVI
ncbi:hypothetical protein [Ensifer sp. ENS07]|nr:hypothetical protein [Ensifer sp. ENS07]